MKLTDFGSAKEMVQKEQQMGSYAQGSPYWMAPEVIKHAQHTYKVCSPTLLLMSRCGHRSLGPPR